jgi:hypothetical protein
MRVPHPSLSFVVKGESPNALAKNTRAPGNLTAEGP